jgi:hypothetical protein
MLNEAMVALAAAGQDRLAAELAASPPRFSAMTNI